MTIVGKGLKLYDPRRDSTVLGGSGPMRINDQSTWRFQTDDGATIGQNVALQALAYQIGWRINGKLSVGRGIPATRIDLQSYITAANLCDETITRADGQTERRYQTGGVFSENDDPGRVLDALAIASNSALRDASGRLSWDVRHNDLAVPIVALGDDDVLSGFTWDPVPRIEQTYNVVRGRYCDPSANSLYQLVDYPEVRIPSVDGIDRVMPLDLPLVDGVARAQRIAKQALQRQQYRGTFAADFGARAWNAQVGDVVTLTFAHNATFDIAFVERLLPGLAGAAWACSARDFDWLEYGFDGAKLGHLLMQIGRFNTGHRAMADVISLLHLLAHRLVDGSTVIGTILARAEQATVRIEATGAGFDKRSLLKGRGYRWDPAARAWWIEIPDEDLEGERLWIHREVTPWGPTPRTRPLTWNERHR